jgi:hypothetical protein
VLRRISRQDIRPKRESKPIYREPRIFGYSLEIASDDVAKKVVQVALEAIFRLREEKPEKDLTVKIATVDELKQSGFKYWFEVRS